MFTLDVLGISFADAMAVLFQSAQISPPTLRVEVINAKCS
jgi:hypothetical protein